MSDLDPITPAEAVSLYMNHREPDLSDKSIQNQRYRLNSFVDWCQQDGIDNLNDLTGRDIHRFRTFRRQEEEVAPITLRGQLATLRVFLEFCASIDAVEEGMRERVLLPEVAPDDVSKDEKLSEEHANDLLDYLETYEYASRGHVIVGILWHTGIRLGSLRAFDLTDYDRDDRCLELRHRPETDTPLKNGTRANRDIAIGEHWCQVLDDYIEIQRHDVTDEHGRTPLITSTHGRLSATAIRKLIYKLTRPCQYGPCPHEKEPETCEYMTRDGASGCESSRSPHSIRRGSITKHLRDGAPEEIVSDRMNVTSDVLEQHYDRRTEREKMEKRRQFLTDT